MKIALRLSLFALIPVLLSSCGYNSMVSKDEAVSSQWANVETAYQRRADLIPNLVSTVKGYADFEQETLTQVVEARAKATAAMGQSTALFVRRPILAFVLNALIVIAGFPALFISVFFGGSLIIENIFSLDGLGQLGFKSAVERDYPVVFGTLFAFGLMGLVVGILSDLMYVWVDPRIDFERRG